MRTARAETRPVRASLASIVLGFELVIVLLATLVIWGLAPAPFGEAGVPSFTVLIGGAVVLLALIVAIGLLPRSLGYLLGWIVQLILILAGFLNPALFIVGALFGGMWWYCMIAGARIDRARLSAREGNS